MEMVEHIYQYYQSERNTAILAGIIGLVLLIGSFAFFQFNVSDKLIKGLTYVFLIAGLFFLIAGVLVTIHNNSKMEETKNFTNTNSELQQSEIKRMKSVLSTGYRSALILFSTLVITGLILILLNPNNLLKGIALGLLIIGTIGHTTEVFSMQKNKVYQQKINSINF